MSKRQCYISSFYHELFLRQSLNNTFRLNIVIVLVQKIGKIICGYRNGFKPIFLCTPTTTTTTTAVVFIKYLNWLRHYILERDSLIDHPIVTNITAVETPIPSHDILYTFWCNIFITNLNKMFGLVQKPQCRVPRAISPHRYNVFQFLQTVA